MGRMNKAAVAHLKKPLCPGTAFVSALKTTASGRSKSAGQSPSPMLGHFSPRFRLRNARQFGLTVLSFLSITGDTK
jgi:hypothetical protein